MRFASYFWPGDLEFSVVSVMLKSWMSSWRSTRPVDTLIMESDRNGIALCQIPCSFFSNIYGRFEKAFARSGCTKIVALGYAANEMPNCVALLTLPDLGGSTTVNYAARIRIHVSVSEGYGYADTAISQKTQYADMFYNFFNK